MIIFIFEKIHPGRKAVNEFEGCAEVNIQKELITLIYTSGPTKWSPTQWPVRATNPNPNQAALKGNTSLSRKPHIYKSQVSNSAFSSVQFSSVTQSCPTLCDPMNRSTPVLPVHHHLPEFTQTHVHRVGDAIQPSHPLSSPLPPVPNPSQHQGHFQWVNSSHEVAKVLEFQL